VNLPSKLLSLVLSFFVFLILSSKSVLALTEHTYFIHQDHLGSVVAVTDENGNAVTQQSYLPYGQVNTNSSTIGNTVERGYTGQIKDANTTLSYYNARYYDPTLGRFISPDSANDQQNRYAYVAGNPIMRSDPSGMIIQEEGAGTRTKIRRLVRLRLPAEDEFDENEITSNVDESSELAGLVTFTTGGTKRCGSFKVCAGFVNVGFTSDQRNLILSALENIPGKYLRGLTFSNYINNRSDFKFKGGDNLINTLDIDFFNFGDPSYSEEFYKGLVVHEIFHATISRALTNYFDEKPIYFQGNPYEPLYEPGAQVTVEEAMKTIANQKHLLKYLGSVDNFTFKRPAYISGDIYAYRFSGFQEFGAEILAHMIYPDYYEAQKNANLLPGAYPDITNLFRYVTKTD